MSPVLTAGPFALTDNISPAEVDYFAHLAASIGGAVVANPPTLQRLAWTVATDVRQGPAAMKVLTDYLRPRGVRPIADATIPSGIVSVLVLDGSST